jgi:DNA helicase-2/ATP-dependent DNA helicase PcrA
MRERAMASRFLKDIPDELFGRRKVVTAAAPTALGIPGVTTGASVWPSRQPAPRQPAKASKFKAGDRVKHNVFGLGIVVSAEPSGADTQVTVAFEEVGIKKLMLSFAPLEKVDL